MKCCPVAACLQSRAFYLSAIVIVPIALIAGAAIQSGRAPDTTDARGGKPGVQSCSSFHASERQDASECGAGSRAALIAPETCTGSQQVAP